MTSGSQRKRAARRAGIETAREEWTDHEFGISLETMPSGRHRVRWQMDQDPTITLLGLSRLRGLLEVVEREYVLGLRQDGDSWDDIGWTLGITGEACRRRHAAAEAELLAALGEEELDD